MDLGITAKNLGWQIVLISFVTFLHQGRKVREKINLVHEFFDVLLKSLACKIKISSQIIDKRATNHL